MQTTTIHSRVIYSTYILLVPKVWEAARRLTRYPAVSHCLYIYMYVYICPLEVGVGDVLIPRPYGVSFLPTPPLYLFIYLFCSGRG